MKREKKKKRKNDYAFQLISVDYEAKDLQKSGNACL